jgi:GDPmannose 4,6-dehydratase
MARILVTGVTGQVGSYVAEQLIASGHEVLGVAWPVDSTMTEGVTRCPSALTPETSVRVIDECGRLDAVVHLAGVSSVAESWRDPLGAFDSNARLTVALVQAVAARKTVRFVHASTAEIFGAAGEPVQTELTPLRPVTPYGVSKAAAHMFVQLGREALRAPMTNLILYLAESERRAPHFVFRKITRGLAAVSLGKAKTLGLGDTSVVRDFSHASDIAAAIVQVALGDMCGDYICASGEAHSIRDVATTACDILGLDPARVLSTDPAFLRPADIPSLVGDSSRLRALGWAPKIGFKKLVERVLEHDIAQLRLESTGACQRI